MQWHPIFAHLLRPLMQDYYEVRTDVPVGDLPRQADLVLLRRTAPAPFLHPNLWEEVQRMIRTTGLEPTLDLRPLIDLVGPQQFIRQMIDQVGLRRIIEAVGLRRIIEEVVLRRIIDEVGLRRVLEVVGPERILAEMGLDWLLSGLTPEQLQELKRRLP
jgi:hypothetical protein